MSKEFPIYQIPMYREVKPRESCPKCGSTEIAVKWQEAYLNKILGEHRPECLRLTCACGYSWTRPCLDAKP